MVVVCHLLCARRKAKAARGTSWRLSECSGGDEEAAIMRVRLVGVETGMQGIIDEVWSWCTTTDQFHSLR